MARNRDLPGGWTTWSAERDGRTVLAYRPDVFDGSTFPPACLPVIYITHGARTRQPGRNPADTTASDDWFVSCLLEPDVHLESGTRFDTREAADAFAAEFAARFDAGEVDYRAAYQVPREDYLDRLDELVGSDGPDRDT